MVVNKEEHESDQYIPKVRMFYLTSRPITMLKETRYYIYGCQQEDENTHCQYQLPSGPIFTSPEKHLHQILYKELIEKTIKDFKSGTLMDLADKFRNCGRKEMNSQGQHDFEHRRIFYCGFGNKDQDGQAYLAAGIHPDYIFIINKKSEIKVFGQISTGLLAGSGEWDEIMTKEGIEDCTLLSYSDPLLASFLHEKLVI